MTKNDLKKILLINLSFWILPLIFILLRLITDTNMLPKNYVSPMKVSIQKILIVNLIFYIGMMLVGLIKSKLSYILFYYNSIMFTGASIIYLDTNTISSYLIKIIPHGVLEILGLAIATYIGSNLKYNRNKGLLKLNFIGLFLIIVSAIIEVKISYNL